VGMTRAIERLYLVRARWYGENKNESKPSAFLTQVDYTNNPLIQVVQVPKITTDIAIESTNELDILRAHVQQEAVEAISGMRLSTALQRIIELEKIRIIEEGRDLSQFDTRIFLSVPDEGVRISQLLAGNESHPIELPTRFSATSLKTYDSCPLKFKFRYVLKIPSEPQIFFDFGSVIHNVIELLATQKMEGVLPTREDAHRVLDLLWPKTAFLTTTQEQEKKETAIRILDTYLAWELQNQNAILGSEESFTFKQGDISFNGNIDRIEQTLDGQLRVIDFKTGKKPSRLTKARIPEEIQLNLYSLAIQNVYGKLPQAASFFYLEEGKMVDYIPTNETIEAFCDKLNEITDAVRNREFDPCPGWDCSYCDYAGLCEALERRE